MKYSLAAIGCAIAINVLFYFIDQGVLRMAAKYLADEPKLINFMSDMGYPKLGEWCGEFAASVIRMAGGTPPSGAAIASNWRGYGTPDAMPRVGDIAVADRGVPTGSIGSHVGFVTAVDFTNGTFTLESGNSSNIYTTRKIGCFSFRAPPNDVLSALIGTGVPFHTAIGNALTGLLFGRVSFESYSSVTAMSPPDPDDCNQGSLDTNDYDEMRNGRRDGEQVCVIHLTSSDAPRFCAQAGRTREPTMFRTHGGCSAMMAKAKQCFARQEKAPACFI